jgi:hypothetical protein
MFVKCSITGHMALALPLTLAVQFLGDLNPLFLDSKG